MKEFKSLIVLSSMELSILVFGQTQPSVPSIISYQGRVTDAAFPILPDGEYEFTFLIFDAAFSENLLWSETQPGVQVSSGIYKVNLGAYSPIPFSALNGRNAYLEVRIFGDTLGPRSRIVSVPFALKAEGEVPEGAIILGEQSGDTAITNLGYTQQGDTIGLYYLYKKDAYNPAQPRVPQRITYQGRLLPADGGTVGSAANFTFTIYDADTAGSSLWTETRNSVPLNDGLFSVELGTVNPIYPTYLSDKDIWLSVSVNGEALIPRERLSGTAYALKVESPVPEGGIVLSSTSANPDLTSKKFTATGTSLKSYYLFRKNVFSSADSSVPLLINYQGRLRDIGGGLISGNTVDLHFSILDTLAGSTLLWSETISSVSLGSGIFNTLLGGINPITPATFTGPNAFLEVKVIQGATVETLSPRQRLTSVPFALQAEGTMPNTTIILGDTIDSPALINSGFQMTGDTIGGFYAYGKTDVDTTPPELTIVSPLSEITEGSTITINITFSDDISGVNLSSLYVYLNNVDITSSLVITDFSASGSVSGVEGGNLLRVELADNAGNSSAKSNLSIIESGTAPTISIVTPLDGQTIPTSTPFIKVQYSDLGSGIDPSTLQITINSVDVTSKFTISPYSARYHYSSDDALGNGPYTLQASVSDKYGNAASPATSNFTINSTISNPSIASMDKDFTIGGDEIVITGMGFGATAAGTKVYFSGTMGQVEAKIKQAGSTQLTVEVPGGAVTGKIWVENTVDGNSVLSKKMDFTLGLPYAYIANRGSGRVTVIDYRDNSIVTSILMPGSDPQPYGADVTPDGRCGYEIDV